MGPRRLGICDSDAGYLRMLQAYLHKRDLSGFQIQIFDTVDKALEAGCEETFEILLVSESIYDVHVGKIPAKKIFILTEDGSAGITGYSMVAKYQSMERLISEVLEGSALDDNIASTVRSSREQARLVSFYAPGRDKGQSIAALAAAQILAGRGERVLYVDLLPFTGYEDLLGVHYDSDVTDLFYFVLDHPDKLLYRLEGIKRAIGGIDHLPPALDYTDLMDVGREAWQLILDVLIQDSGYTYIVMDVSEACQGFYQILARSTIIYTLTDRSDVYSQAMLSHYKRLLKAKEYQDILGRTMEFALPPGWEHCCSSLEGLAASPVGACMKGVLGGHE